MVDPNKEEEGENKNGIDIAIVQSQDLILIDIQSALDLIATIDYEVGCNRFVIKKEAVIEDFFKLSTCIAGDILQKFINYHIKFAVYGDFSIYTSKPLNDFIYESNKGNNIYFTSTVEEAIDRLAKAK